MNKYIVYWFGVIMAMGIIDYNFFTTRATIVIDNYNSKSDIEFWDGRSAQRIRSIITSLYR